MYQGVRVLKLYKGHTITVKTQNRVKRYFVNGLEIPVQSAKEVREYIDMKIKEEQKLKEPKLINGKNYCNIPCFKQMCQELEKGQRIEVYIDCIGHTRNNYEQESYRKLLQDKYGDKLETELSGGTYSYSYIYQLKQ